MNSKKNWNQPFLESLEVRDTLSASLQANSECHSQSQASDVPFTHGCKDGPDGDARS